MSSYPDIGFTPEYQALFADTAFGGKPECFCQGGIEYRYYVREIPGTEFYDITSPYGYSGPCPISESPNWTWFLREFHDYCQVHNIIAEFARLHPWEFDRMVLQSEGNYPYCIVYEREIVYIDLTQSEEQIWQGFDKGCKSAIKGIGPIWRWDGVTLSFEQLYQDTMRFRKAGVDYLFDDAFLCQLNPLAVTFGQRDQQACVLRYGDYCHYFLAAGQGKAGNAIVWEAIRWAKSQGCKIFNLGGGLKAGDSLESFKRSFSKTTEMFCTYRKVHNQEVYDELCKAKGIDPQSEGFFPAYRRAELRLPALLRGRE